MQTSLAFGFWSLFNPSFNTFLLQNVVDHSLQVFMVSNEVLLGQVIQVVKNCSEVEISPSQLKHKLCY